MEGMPKSSKESTQLSTRDREDRVRPTPALLPIALTLFRTAVAWELHADLVFHAKISTLI
jgi:hypothetical protein